MTFATSRLPDLDHSPPETQYLSFVVEHDIPVSMARLNFVKKKEESNMTQGRFLEASVNPPLSAWSGAKLEWQQAPHGTIRQRQPLPGLNRLRLQELANH